MAESRSLGEAIRLRRVELGMSQEELAERIGPDVRQSDVSRLERGKILFPRLERLNQIANALGVSVGTLLIEAGWFTGEEGAMLDLPVSANPKARVPIVVADDEPISLDAIASLLEDHGYTARTAYDLDSLIQTIRTSAPEVVLVDFALPGLKPESIADLTSSCDPCPILVFMGAGLPQIEIDGPYLEKPIDSRQLVAFLASIERQRSSRQSSPNGTGQRTGV